MLDVREVRPSAQVASVRPVGDERETLQFGVRSTPVVFVQIQVCWGDAVLCVQEVNARSGFVVGSGEHDVDVDFFAPAACLGEERWRLLEVDDDDVFLLLPAGASGRVTVDDEASYELDTLRATCKAAAGGQLLRLAFGMVAEVELGSLCFRVAPTQPQKPMPRSLVGDFRNVLGFFGASALSTGALLGAMAFFVPPLGINDNEAIDADRLYLMQQYLEASAQREEEQKPTDQTSDEGQSGGQEGARATGEEGASGKPDAPKSRGKIAVKGPADNPRPEVMPISEAQTFGMIGLLSAGLAHDGPSAPWARDDALGNASENAFGALWGDEIGDNFGSGGLALAGPGEGGGGRYQGIGLGTVGTLGSLGNCVGAECMGIGTGFSRGLTKQGHRPKGVIMRMAEPTVSGRLPKETIQRIVRQHFGRYRVCYEKALAKNPTLTGRVSVRFLISSDGSVSTAGNGASTLPDAAAVSCVVRAFYGLSFPKPAGGSVQVTYPLMFSPN